MKVTKIRMKPGKADSNNPMDIDQLFLADAPMDGFMTKGDIHGYVRKNLSPITVDAPPYPVLIATSNPDTKEKYLMTGSLAGAVDVLMTLPRE